MEEKNDLYIPIGLKDRYELWNGFGKEELVKSLIINLVLGIINIILYIINRNIPSSIVFFMVSVAGAIMMLTKDTTNLSVVDQLQNMIGFSKSQKQYLYEYLDEYK